MEKNYILAKIVKSIYDLRGPSKGLIYHLWCHTARVRDASSILSDMENVSQHDMELLDAASILHDVGNIIERTDHEKRSVEFAKTTLPYLGFVQEDIDIISTTIMATKFPQRPNTLIERILADADLSLIGHSDWCDVIDGYRHELGVSNMQTWHRANLELWINHDWWTDSAKELYDKQKYKNIDWIKSQLK